MAGKGAAELRKKIVRTAGKMFGAHGFGAISVADIAAECGISKQSLFYHFPTKDALKLAVIDELVDQGNQTLLALLANVSADGRDRMERMLASLQTMLNKVPWAAALTLRTFLDDDKEGFERLRDGTLAWARYATDEVGRGAVEGRYRKTSNPAATIEQVALLSLVNFALLGKTAWGEKSVDKARDQKLRELLRVLGLIIYPEAAEKKKPAKKKHATTQRNPPKGATSR